MRVTHALSSGGSWCAAADMNPRQDAAPAQLVPIMYMHIIRTAALHTV
jgi:hypothetical protein